MMFQSMWWSIQTGKDLFCLSVYHTVWLNGDPSLIQCLPIANKSCSVKGWKQYFEGSETSWPFNPDSIWWKDRGCSSWSKDRQKTWKEGAKGRNWRGDTRRNGKETDRQPHAPERQPSPETWRKPVEQQLKSAPGAASTRYSRAASAVELAQAFSRSVSDPKVNDRFSGQRGLNTGNSSRTQVPFSRLVGPTSRPQINGY